MISVLEQILDTSLASLRNHAELLDIEQAVRGLDSLTELQFHQLVEQGFRDAGFGVNREAHYPSDGDAYTNANHRQRCDFALSLNPDIQLHDPVIEMHQLALAQDTLFAGVPQSSPDPSEICMPEDAMWIEIKACAQHAYRDGVPGPNAQFGSELIKGLQTDICKLSADPRIWHGCALVILFTESEKVALHDLNHALRVCLDQNLPIRSPLIGSQSITDRANNGCVTIAIFPVSI